jgi:hypothetical protein
MKHLYAVRHPDSDRGPAELLQVYRSARFTLHIVQHWSSGRSCPLTGVGMRGGCEVAASCSKNMMIYGEGHGYFCQLDKVTS